MSQSPSSRSETIYVPLLDEGTDVLRPTEGLMLQQNIYRVLATPTYETDYETWKFPPGSVVSCVLEQHGGDVVLVARKLANA